MIVKRIIGFLFICFGVLIVGSIIITLLAGNKDSVTSLKNNKTSNAVQTSAAEQVVPWDYKIEQRKVGDLINGDMTLLPDNALVSNDDNYATGDSVWVLQSMNAVMKTRDDGKSDVTLTVWKPLKTYRKEDDAKADLAKLKESVQTDVDLVGVYKTELDGKFREFAVVKLPSGQTIKQPIDDKRYQDFKSKKQVKAALEVVHDFNDYDQAFPKFRGWAS
jgi:hypothetical protein